ncbi:hypothetical protein CAPN001_12110 [Capnocytophaga stomatis]|uniref:minor capsid protein n=1 Tax=Capnocytophaga stomatis TaxID=1848904 RepID=UPI001951A721|nr:minor capsid protein [Capnocytophaga stomatis]GIJ96642.1 hypothetical protein CAPN001_12110 [Capnocytophaga stomatis]GIM50752.1 hypothetical protein CAPN003_22040 [Capnocytophaga stomatis]
MSFADDLEDFFSKLSERWLYLVRSIYKNKGLPDELIYEPIVREQAQQLSKAIEQAFDESGYDTPDYKMREFLKKNVWEFSVAKNYNDNIALNNLLLKSDGSLRNWNDFKREAQKVVGNSIRYLKTEYNTVVLGAQNASLWADIQKTKHLFPYLQFNVVLDGHTSEICKPLHGVVVSVDDPMLKYYFPPNHFNCRTTVRQLRKGTPTENYAVPDIPDAFKNNPGITGKVFTQKNSYIVNTPSDVLILATGFYKDDGQKAEILSKSREEQFKKLFEAENGGQVLEHLLLRKGKDYESILASAKEFAKQGKIAEILPELNQKGLKSYRKVVFPNYDLNKNPDLRVDGIYHDVKEVESLKKITSNANRASTQGAIAIIQYDGSDLTEEKMIQQVKRIFGANNINENGVHNYPYKQVYFLHNGKLYKYNRD